MTAKTDPATDFQAAAVANAMRLVTLFHTAVRVARQILADGPDQWYADDLLRSVSLALNSMAAEDVALPDHLVDWVRREPRRGSGAGTASECENSDRWYWEVEGEDGWEVVSMDAYSDEPDRRYDDVLYWGGEMGSVTLVTAVAEALHYQVKWPQAVVRITLNGEQVMLIPPIDGELCGICGGPLKLNGACLDTDCPGNRRPDDDIMDKLGLGPNDRLIPIAHLPPPDPSTYRGLCHVCNVAGTNDQGLCLDADCPGSLPSPQNVDEEVIR